MQNAWNKYGEKAFRFIHLDQLLCSSKEIRIALEASWVLLRGNLNSRPVNNCLSRFSASPESIQKVTSSLLRVHRERPELGKNLSQRNIIDWRNPKIRNARIENRKLTIKSPEGKIT